MTRPSVQQVLGATEGFYRVYVYHRGSKVEVTTFRGAPVEVDFSTTDPFGAAEATVTFPAITILEERGVGDLYWYADERHFDIVWCERTIATGALVAEHSLFEGYMVSEEAAAIGSAATMVGALRQLDNYQAVPAYVQRPMPYEEAIRQAFKERPDLNLKPLVIEFPENWRPLYNAAEWASQKPYMRPEGKTIAQGKPWTALLTRETGRFEPVLTSYVQGILANMQSPYGPWTISLDPGRQPRLHVRRRPNPTDVGVYVVDAASPGLKDLTARKDNSQKANVVYGQGRGLTGASYTGQQVTVAGNTTETSYEPYAASKQVHPTTDNRWFDPAVMRKEISIQFAEGLLESEAIRVAELHHTRFADPGLTGEFTLVADPRRITAVDGTMTTVPRQTVKAGSTFVIRNLLGNRDGTPVHITETRCDNDGNVVCTYDSRYRDQLTVAEVRRRGRDALRPARLLTVGNYEPNVPDLLYPWSYERGSGYLPKTSVTMWRGTKKQPRAYDQFPFPWTELTLARPPKTWSRSYAKIGPVSTTDARKNWAVIKGIGPHVLMSAANDIRLFQIAAYDEDGNVLPVTFHVSLYYENTVQPQNMPLIPTGKMPGTKTSWAAAINGQKNRLPHNKSNGIVFKYKAGQPYPFYKNAFNTGFDPDTGARILGPEARAVAGGTLIAGWGNGYERAGYWPGSQESRSPATGMLVDETGFSYNIPENTTSRFQVGMAPVKPSSRNAHLTRISAMIYCDDHGDEPVYFLGRMYRVEPGSQGG